MDEPAKSLSAYRLQRAWEDLDSSRLNLNHHQLRTALNRSYYAMLHAIRALLALEKTDFKTHKGVINHFNRNYIQTGKFPKTFGRIVALAEGRRIDSDYDEFYETNFEEASQLIYGSRTVYQSCSTVY